MSLYKSSGHSSVNNDKNILKQDLQKEKHLNRILKAIRKVNHLIVRERDPGVLIRKASRLMVEDMGYFNAWIVLLDEGGAVSMMASSGMGDEADSFEKQLRAGQLPPCVPQALSKEDTVVVDDPPNDCPQCPLAENYSNRSGMCQKIFFEDRVFGAVVASLPSEFSRSEEEKGLFRELAMDVGLALYNIDLEKARAESEEKLQQSEENLYITLQSIGDGVIATDLAGKITRMNPVAEQLTGWSLDEAMGRPLPEVFRIFNSLTGRSVENPASIVLKSGKTVGMANDTMLVSKDGERYQIADSAAPITSKDGIITGVVLVFADVTGSYRQKEELKGLKERYKAIFDYASDAILIMEDGVFTDCNKRAIELFGGKREDIINRSPYELSPEKQPGGEMSEELSFVLLKQAERAKSAFFEWQHLTVDGKPFDAEVSLNIFELDGKKLTLSIVRDVTQRKKEESLRQVIYKIAGSVVASKSIEELISDIRSHISSYIETTNFYIALYDEKSSMLSIPYEKDEKDNIETWPAKGSATGLVVEEKRALLLKKPDILKLIAEGRIRQVGSMSEVWLGVPLVSGDDVIGAIVVQNYDDPDTFDEESMEILGFVSSQISMAIQRKRADEDLINAKNKAEESDRLKTAFLNNLSHEIRTPLNAIIGFSELLRSNRFDKEKVDHLTNIICQSSSQLLSVIDDIINMSTIETGLAEAHLHECNVAEVLNSLYYQMQPIADEKGLKFRLSIMLKPEEARVVTDQTKLLQVLTNLTHNALKFTNEGHVEVGCRKRDDELLFVVADTGMGIPASERELVFERFMQLDNGTENSGMGLGLAICKSFVEMLGGKIWLESDPGKGSMFFFTIPIESTSRDQSVTPKTRGFKIYDRVRVLVAEDEEHNYELTRVLLEEQDVEVLHAWDGEEAVRICESNNDINMVLMDIKMPVMDGLEATKVIKEKRPDIPVIALTAYAQPGDRDKALKTGCDDYIAKPVNIDSFRTLVRKYL